MKRIVVQWPRFGPYHLARLRAAQKILTEQGIELAAMETAATDTLYAWRREERAVAFEHVRVFTKRPFESIEPREMHVAVQKSLDAIDPDVVAIHSYSFPDARASLDWSRRKRRGIICMTDSKADDAERIGWREYVKSKIINSYDAALLAGSPQRAYFESLGFPSDAIFTGYDVVDNAFFADGAAAARAGLNENVTPHFLASNRFIARKNLDGLVRAYADYRSRTETPWDLVLLGDGELRSELEHRVESEGIQGVQFAGFRQIEELPGFYARASVFVHPCLIDTWALVVNEAMACGLPVLVSTGAGCHIDLVREGYNGFTFDPLDVRGLADIMVRITKDDDWLKSAGQASREIIEAWPVERFGHALLKAARYAHRASHRRRYHPVARLVVNALRFVREPTAFHTVES